MKRKSIIFMLASLTFAVFLTVMAPRVYAATEKSIQIPVAITLDGYPPAVAEDYEIVLAADNEAYPMPANSESGRFTTTLTGAAAASLPAMNFDSIGVFTYTIYQTPGSNELADYDDSVYNLVVYVTNAKEGSGLETTVILYKVGQDDKYSEVAFSNKYAAEPTPPVQPKPAVPSPVAPAKTTQFDPPSTGDDTVIMPYVIALAAGLGLLLWVMVSPKSKNRHNNE